jgi:hypothetical protein
MKYSIFYSLGIIISLLFPSCKSTYTYSLVTLKGKEVNVALNKRIGRWVAKFDRDVIYNELVSYPKDTNLVVEPEFFFQKPANINSLNGKGQKTGLWITANNKGFKIENYRKGLLHGQSITYLNNNETIECQFKKGEFHGLYERKLGNHAFVRKYYKNGKLKKLAIISPSW